MLETPAIYVGGTHQGSGQRATGVAPGRQHQAQQAEARYQLQVMVVGTGAVQWKHADEHLVKNGVLEPAVIGARDHGIDGLDGIDGIDGVGAYLHVTGAGAGLASV